MDKSYDETYESQTAEWLFDILHRKLTTSTSRAIRSGNPELDKWYQEMVRRTGRKEIICRISLKEEVTKNVMEALNKAFRD